jgi:hypothetical protein
VQELSGVQLLHQLQHQHQPQQAAGSMPYSSMQHSSM